MLADPHWHGQPLVPVGFGGDDIDGGALRQAFLMQDGRDGGDKGQQRQQGGVHRHGDFSLSAADDTPVPARAPCHWSNDWGGPSAFVIA